MLSKQVKESMLVYIGCLLLVVLAGQLLKGCMC